LYDKTEEGGERGSIEDVKWVVSNISDEGWRWNVVVDERWRREGGRGNGRCGWVHRLGGTYWVIVIRPQLSRAATRVCNTGDRPVSVLDWPARNKIVSGMLQNTVVY
jgi:hypothetical protein